ncbi:MAG: DUF547 domain-containing protein [Alphaproteobacteria bacterium]|nr:MAG: DUF547 domain-containing protein [Alphaproteobacteria bacterium]
MLFFFFTLFAQSIDDFQQHSNTSQEEIDHDSFNMFLQKYTVILRDGRSVVKYKDAKHTKAARDLLNDYINYLKSIPIAHYNKREQLAFWINLYNALTILLVLDHYPVKSIQDINIGFLSFFGPWKQKLIKISGVELSLYDIENNILRTFWKDARIHYALNCASYSCPNLRNQAYKGKDIDLILDRVASLYINHRRGVAVDADNGYLRASKIYKWYSGDFEPSVLEHLKKYARPDLKEALEHRNWIDGYDYDWRLNDFEEPRK